MITFTMSNAYVLASDNNQLPYLKWMLEQLKAHKTQYPIIIVDLGITDSLDDDDIFLIKPRIQENIKGWYCKPRAIQAAYDMGYDKVCWLDNDLEILSNIDDIFDISPKNKLTIAIDDYANLRSPYTVWNSGVVVYSGAEKLLYEWIRRSDQMIERGDQEALAYVLHYNNSLKDYINNLDTSYNWLRLMGEPKKNCKIRHWTGPIGKKHIRETIWKLQSSEMDHRTKNI